MLPRSLLISIVSSYKFISNSDYAIKIDGRECLLNCRCTKAVSNEAYVGARLAALQKQNSLWCRRLFDDSAEAMIPL